MLSHFWRPVRLLTAAALAPVFAFPPNVSAQASEHVVSPQDLNQAAQNATRIRQQNLDSLRSFLSSPQARKALESAHVDARQVQNAVSGLSDQELTQLAARANKAQNDFAAGNIDNHDLLIIVVAIAVLILIIVAVR